MSDTATEIETETARTFTTIGVVGLGTMGAGIAEVFAREGFSVVGVERDDEGLERGRQHLEHSTGRAVKREKITEAEQAELLGRITFTTSLKNLTDADLVVEAVVESLELKKSIMAELDAIVSPDTILATNTSSLSVTEISTANARPGRVVGVHFFNPVLVQNLVEVVNTVVTEPQVLADTTALVRTLGKSPVVCGDKAGFIANTLLFGYLNHAASMFESRYASREDIDAAMRFGCGYPMGPLALLDLIGLDTAYEILETMYRQGLGRPAARAYAGPQADGHRGDAGPEVRPRLLHLRGSRQPDRRGRRPDAVRRRGARAEAPDREGRRRGHRHDGLRDRRGVRQGRLRRARRRPQPGQGRRRQRGHHQELRQADPARQGHRGCQGRGARPGHRQRFARRPRRRRPRGGRRSPRTSRSRPRSSRTSTRSARRGRSSPPPPRRCRSSRAPRPPRGHSTSSACTSSTPRP